MASTFYPTLTNRHRIGHGAAHTMIEVLHEEPGILPYAYLNETQAQWKGKVQFMPKLPAFYGSIGRDRH